MAKIFISYARADSEFALRLAAELRAQGVRLWLDQFDIKPGADWGRSVDAALAACETFLIILSPASIESDNVLDELTTALDDKKRIIPLLYQPCRMPLRLRRLQYVDFTVSHDTGKAGLFAALEIEEIVVEPPAPAPRVEPPITESSPSTPSQPPEPKRQQLPQPQAKPLSNQISDAPAKATPTSAYARMAARQHIPVFARPHWSVPLTLLIIPIVTGIVFWMMPDSTPRSTNSPIVSDASPAASIPAKTAAQGQGFTETVNGVKFEMVRVPAGSFLIGSPDGQGSHDEHPQHRVNVAAFYLGKTEITQALWQAVMSNNPSRFKGDLQHPVEQVSWDDAKEFCNKLKQRTGHDYRLPSEAEWEYACRAGTTGDYAGDLDAMAWYSKTSGNSTHPVGQKQPNKFGLYDMHGNVWEWCEDVWHDNYNGAPTDGSAWVKGGDQNSRILRGGSWAFNYVYARAVFRRISYPAVRYYDFGFRVVVVSSPS